MGANGAKSKQRSVTRRKNIGDIELEPSQFCVVEVPTSSGTTKNFVGQVTTVDTEGFLIRFLKKSFDKYFFCTTR